MVFIVVLYVSMPVRIYSDLGMLLQHVALHFLKKNKKRNNKKKHMCVWDARCSVSVRFYSMLPPRVHKGTFWTSKTSNIRGPPGRQVGVELPRNVLKHHGPINHCASSIRLVSALCNKWSSSTHTHAHTHARTRTQYTKMLVALLVVVQVTLIIHSTHSILSQSRFE